MNRQSAAAASASTSNGVLPGGSATEQYNYAFGLMKQAQYPAAEAAFKEFVAAHPKDQMAGNAQYWLGETYYARGKYMEAASAFAEGYKRYPKNAKAPDDTAETRHVAGPRRPEAECLRCAREARRGVPAGRGIGAASAPPPK